MVNLLPAILIGGPPHAGKSVLFYSLTQTLRARHVRHHAIRACPDGEGNWSQELDQDTVSLIRSRGKWTDDFVRRIYHDLERRHLPLLVDMGGSPTESQQPLLRCCTHSLLLFRTDRDDATRFWRRIADANGLLPLASLYSEIEGSSVLRATFPTVEGTITGLHRGAIAHGPIFDALVERIVELFSSYTTQELEKILVDQAPTELVVNLHLSLQSLNPLAHRWELSMLPRLLDDLPPDTPLAVYGQGPHWLYAALAAHVSQQPFYQFDPRLGWIDPLPIESGTPTLPDIEVRLRKYDESTLLSVNIVPKHLDYFQSEPVAFPAVPLELGLILDGSMPSWLVTALVRLYHVQGIAWIACHQPQLKGAVVVASRIPARTAGELVPIRIHE